MKLYFQQLYLALAFEVIFIFICFILLNDKIIVYNQNNIDLGDKKELDEKNFLDFSTNEELNDNKINLGISYHTISRIGGIETFIGNFANNIVKTGLYNVYVFTGKKTNNDIFFNDDIEIVYDAFDEKNMNKEVFTKFIVSKKIDVIVNNNYLEGNIVKDITTICKKRGIKIITIIHNFFMHRASKTFLDHINYYYNEYKNIDVLINIVPNEDFIWKRLNIISYFIANMPLCDFDKVKRSELSTKNILLVGRGRTRAKRFELGIKAMQYVINEFPDAKLRILSGGNLDHLKNIAQEIGVENNVEFVGFTKTPELYYRNAVINLLPSEYEGYPYVLLEAKMHGLINIVSGKNYLALNKKGVIIVPHDDYKAIGKEIIHVLKDETLRQKISKEAIESLNDFTLEKVLKRWNDLISALYNNKLNELIEQQYYNETESYDVLYDELIYLYKLYPHLEDRYENITYKQIFDKNMIFDNGKFIYPEEKGKFFNNRKYYETLETYNDYINISINNEILIPKNYLLNKMKYPLISVIIPCHNCTKTIGRVLTSIINQYYQNFEIIIIDDSSTDDSAKKIMEFTKIDNRIKLITNKKYEGNLSCRFIGFSYAKGTYILNLYHNDIIFNPFLFEDLSRNLGNEDIIQFENFVFNYNTIFLSEKHLSKINNTNIYKKEDVKVENSLNNIHINNIIAKRSTYEEAFDLLNLKYIYNKINLLDDYITSALLIRSSIIINKIDIYGIITNSRTYLYSKNTKLNNEFMILLNIYYDYKLYSLEDYIENYIKNYDYKNITDSQKKVAERKFNEYFVIKEHNKKKRLHYVYYEDIEDL